MLFFGTPENVRRILMPSVLGPQVVAWSGAVWETVAGSHKLWARFEPVTGRRHFFEFRTAPFGEDVGAQGRACWKRRIAVALRSLLGSGRGADGTAHRRIGAAWRWCGPAACGRVGRLPKHGCDEGFRSPALPAVG